MSLILAYWIAFAALLVMTAAFKSPSNQGLRHATQISMSSTGAKQVLGSSVITTTTTKIPHDDSQTSLRRRARGSGFDERNEFLTEEEIGRTVSNIDKYFRQKSLLSNLQGERWGLPEKLERIRLAASVDGTISSTILPGSTTKTPSLSAGGLFKEWESDIGF
jgi:hypothetical protein